MNIVMITQYIALVMLFVSFALTIWSLYYNKKQADIRELTKQVISELVEIKDLLKGKK